MTRPTISTYWIRFSNIRSGLIQQESDKNNGESSRITTTGRRRPTLVPTLRVGMPSATLGVAAFASAPPGDAERPGRHSHAERGNEGKTATTSLLYVKRTVVLNENSRIMKGFFRFDARSNE